MCATLSCCKLMDNSVHRMTAENITHHAHTHNCCYVNRLVAQVTWKNTNRLSLFTMHGCYLVTSIKHTHSHSHPHMYTHPHTHTHTHSHSALTEKIVAVLPRMKCPHRLEPHQIQGLDFIHIYPVIQWLVKLAIATREEMGDYIRAFSESQFSRDHRTTEAGRCGFK